MGGCLWTFLPGMQLFLFSFFFFSPGPKHNGKPLILYCSVMELDQKSHHGLGSIPPASPSPIFTSSQHQRSPSRGSTFGDGSETRWLGPTRQPPAVEDGIPSAAPIDGRLGKSIASIL